MESSGNSATGSPYITQANPQPISKPGNATYIFRTQWHLFLPPVYKGRAGQLHYEMPCSGIALDVAYTAKTQVRSWSSYTCISSENRKRWRRKILRAQENAPHIRPSLFWKYEFRRDCLCVGLSLSPSGSVSLPLSLYLSPSVCLSDSVCPSELRQGTSETFTIAAAKKSSQKRIHECSYALSESAICYRLYITVTHKLPLITQTWR